MGKLILVIDSLPLLSRDFTDLHQSWYKKIDGKQLKVLPANIAELLTPIALAYWLCGYGHYHKTQGSIVIAKNSYTLTEVDLLRSILLENYHINSTRYSGGKEDQ
jgi:LAGLIDADG DNA endonuclease family